MWTVAANLFFQELVSGAFVESYGETMTEVTERSPWRAGLYAGSGAPAAARLPVLGPWTALRSGSACHRIPGFSPRDDC